MIHHWGKLVVLGVNGMQPYVALVLELPRCWQLQLNPGRVLPVPVIQPMPPLEIESIKLSQLRQKNVISPIAKS